MFTDILTVNSIISKKIVDDLKKLNKAKNYKLLLFLFVNFSKNYLFESLLQLVWSFTETDKKEVISIKKNFVSL